MASGNRMRTVYTTIDSEEAASRVARSLLQDRLVACANILPLRSLYWWKGAIQEKAEVGMLLKTTEERLDELCKVIAARHPYEVPCIEVWPVDGVDERFAAWLRDSVEDGKESVR